jgi:hypothetical protein
MSEIPIVCRTWNLWIVKLRNVYRNRFPRFHCGLLPVHGHFGDYCKYKTHSDCRVFKYSSLLENCVHQIEPGSGTSAVTRHCSDLHKSAWWQHVQKSSTTRLSYFNYQRQRRWTALVWGLRQGGWTISGYHHWWIGIRDTQQGAKRIELGSEK